MEASGVKGDGGAGRAAAEEEDSAAGGNERREPLPDPRVAGAVHGGISGDAGGGFARNVHDLRAEARGGFETPGAAAGDDRLRAPSASRRGPEKAERPRAVDQERLRRRSPEPVPSVQDRGERIEERGDLVGKVRRRPVEVRPHDRRRHAQKLRERAPRSFRVSEGAEVRASAEAVAAGPARPRHRGHDPIAGAKSGDSFAGFDDLAAGLVPHRHGERDPRVSPREKLQVRAASQRGANTEHDLARTRAGNGKIPFLVLPDRRLDEGPHRTNCESRIENCEFNIPGYSQLTIHVLFRAARPARPSGRTSLRRCCPRSPRRRKPDRRPRSPRAPRWPSRLRPRSSSPSDC